MSAETVRATLCDPVLIAVGVEHGFGRRGSRAPHATLFPTQVHGSRVVEAGAGLPSAGAEADAVLAREPGVAVGIVTADCVPILAASEDGAVVVAIHAGWRGLAAGVVEAGIEALRARAAGAPLRAAVGPCARGCCYEVDEPVRRALEGRCARDPGALLVPARAGHFQLDLGGLAARVLVEAGVPADRIGLTHCVCTICDADRFHSYRREGAAAGRLAHFIRRSGSQADRVDSPEGRS
jgi:YfiH family protein